MKRFISLMLAVICLSMSVTGFAESMVSVPDGMYLISDRESMFVVKENGDIAAYAPDSDVAVAITSIDTERDYPLCCNGNISIYRKESAALRRSDDHFVELPGSLTGGGDNWWISNVQRYGESDYFVFHDTETEEMALCRYDDGSNRLSHKEIGGFQDYFIQEDGTVFAVTYNHQSDVTTVIRVNWGASTDLEVCSLEGKYEYFQGNDGVFYAICADKSIFVQIVDGQVKTSVFSAFATSVTDSVFVQGRFWVLGTSGLYSPDWSAVATKARVLRIPGSGPNPIDQEFLLQHSDVRIEYVPSTAYEEVGMYNAIISGVIDLDVCIIDTSTAAEAFLSKGYTLDLSVNPILQAKGEAMYQPIKDFIFRDGKFLMIPYTISLDNVLEYQPESCAMAGISVDDLPDTIEELLDLIICWEDVYGLGDAVDPVVPMLFEEQVHRNLVNMVIDSYIANSRHTGAPLRFNTETFKHLLEKARVASDKAPIQTNDYCPARLFVQVGREIPGIHSVVFPLEANESPKYTGRITGWAVCADAEDPELAMEYIIFRMGKMTKATEVLLYDREYEAIERDDYFYFLDVWQTELNKLNVMLESESNPITQRSLKEQISTLEDRIQNPPDSFRYAITTEEILFYQNEVIPNIEITYGNPITNAEVSSLWAHTLVKQYVEGLLSEEAFIRELDQRMWMMQMEAGE